MMHIIWMPEASDDMEAMFEYYKKKNEKTAVAMYNNIIEDVDLLATNPYLAPESP